jgi:hypothetical protein
MIEHYPATGASTALMGTITPLRLGFIDAVDHAQALDHLGFLPHNGWINRFGSRMFGIHIHDVVGLSDHLAPGLGRIDFKRITAFLPHDAFRTLELKPGNTLAQVNNGIHLVIDSGCVCYPAKE